MILHVTVFIALFCVYFFFSRKQLIYLQFMALNENYRSTAREGEQTTALNESVDAKLIHRALSATRFLLSFT